MTPPHSSLSANAFDQRQPVRRPRASDGVGNALRQIYTGQPALPRDLAELLARLSRD